MKTETFNAIGNSHKRCFLEVFIMIPLWAVVHYGLLCALRTLLAPSVVSIVVRQKISAASTGDYLLLFVVLLGSLESPPSSMVTRNLWSARVWVRD